MKRILTLLACLLLGTALYSQPSQVKMPAGAITLSQALQTISSQSGYKFFYSDGLFDPEETVTIKGGTLDIKAALAQVFSGKGIEATVVDSNIILSKSKDSAKPDGSESHFEGRILDEGGQPVPGAVVLSRKGARRSAVSDLDGNFRVPAKAGEVFEVSCMGFETIEVKATEGRAEVVMQTLNQLLEESVVVGYGTQRRGSITGSVSGVSGDDMLKTRNENPQNLLTGRVSGLRMWQQTAEPGAYAASFDIRGFGTPLVVIDGVPGDIADFQRLNPNDIENVSVLKDASAAIYGVRAANGVILVTTRSGAEGRTKVNLSSSFTFQTPAGLPELAGLKETFELYNEKARHALDGGSPVYTQEMINEWMDGTRRSSDWNSYIIQKMAPQTQHSLSVSGGTSKVKYYFSAGYLYQDSFFKSGDLNYSKSNVSSRITADLVPGLKLGLLLGYWADTQNKPTYDSATIIQSWWEQGPLYPVFADDAETLYSYEEIYKDQNAAAMMTADVSGYRKFDKSKIQMRPTVDFDFSSITPALKGLTARGMFDYEYRHDEREDFRKEYYQYQRNRDGSFTEKLFSQSTPNRLYRSHNVHKDIMYQAILNYDRDFGRHHVSGLLGWEEQIYIYKSTNAQSDLEYASPWFSAASTTGQIVGGAANLTRRYRSLIGKFNYSYANRYMFEAQFRYDQSSKFAPGHQWGFFPSMSAGWRISEEPWFKDSPLRFINLLKLRASYGVIGDDSGVNYEWVNGYTYRGGQISASHWYTSLPAGTVFNGNFVYGAKPQPLPNENITWLQSKTFNVGVDFSAWNGMLGFSLEYFKRIRDGIFRQNSAEMPLIVGAEAPMENADRDSHFGLELEISHKHKVGDFNYGLKAITSITRRKYLKAVQNDNYGNSYEKWRNDNLNNRYQGISWNYNGIGRYESWYDIWADDGIQKPNNLLPGYYKYEDWNGDGQIDSNDMYPNAYTETPWLNYSLAFDCSWKGLDLSVLFQGSALGSMTYETPLYAIWGQNGGGVLTHLTDRWHPLESDYVTPYDQSLTWVKGNLAMTGHPTDQPYVNSSFNRVSTAFLRLKSVELGYTFRSLFKKYRSSSLRLYANAYNPLTITKVKYVDPEHSQDNLGRQYPLNKSYTLGLQFAF